MSIRIFSLSNEMACECTHVFQLNRSGQRRSQQNYTGASQRGARIKHSTSKPLLSESPINFGDALNIAAKVSVLSFNNRKLKKIHLLKNMFSNERILILTFRRV